MGIVGRGGECGVLVRGMIGWVVGSDGITSMLMGNGMKSLLIASAVIELLAGVGLLVMPGMAVELVTGETVDAPAVMTMCRIGGCGLVSLGISCWLGRLSVGSRAARDQVISMLFYNVAVAGVLAYGGISAGTWGMALWPAAGMHVGMGVWCLACLLKNAEGESLGT